MALETNQFTLTPAQAQPIVDETRNYSVITRLGTQVPITEGGTKFPVFGARPTAQIVGERGQKPVVDFSVGHGVMTKRKFAMMTVMSAEVARADLQNALGVGAAEKSNGVGISNFVARCKTQIAESFAIALDNLAFHGGVAGEHYLDEATQSITLGASAANKGGVYADLNQVLALQAAKTPKRKTTAFLFDSSAEHILNGSVDANGRPTWVDAPVVDENSPFRLGRVLGRRSVMADDLEQDGVVGYAGRWDHVFYGILAAPSFRLSTEMSYTDPATGQLRSAPEHNEVVIIAEFEAGVLVYDPEDFVKILAPGEGS